MTEKTISKSFPENSHNNLDEEILKLLLTDCGNEYINWLSSLGISTRSKTICKTIDNGIRCDEEEFPDFPRYIPKGVTEVLQKKEISAFFQYLWEKGAQPRKYTGPNPTRKTWELDLLNKFIHNPLIRILNEQAIENAIDEKKDIPWKVSPVLLSSFTEEISSRLCNDSSTYIAKCPLAYFEGKTGSEYKLSNEVSLKLYNERERASYLTRHNYKLSVTNFHSSISFSKAVLEVRGIIKGSEVGAPENKGGTKGDIAEKQISDTIDCVKWALFVALDKHSPLIEGDIVYEDILGGDFARGILRREEKSSGTSYEIDEVSLKSVKQHISLVSKYIALSDDIQQAIWHWGRSCHYNLSRDILLESIIGLEGLLVANAGETRYKFGLHGSALLSKTLSDKESIAKKLRSAYDGRSSIAHGSKKHKLALHNDARVYLANAILRLIELYEEGILDPSSNASKQIEKIILNNSTIGGNTANKTHQD